MSYSFKSIVDGGADSDIIYYNALLTSTQTSDAQSAQLTNVVRFNETRNAPIVRDASQYYFSLVRFAMNGPGKNLPLFIPLIQTNSNEFPTQTDPNRTIYNATIAYQREWNYTDSNGVAQTKIFTITPTSTPILYIPETQNTLAAPVPFAPATGFKKQDLSTRYYWIYTYKHFVQLVNNAFQAAMYSAYTAFGVAWAATPLMASPFPYTTFNDWLLAHDAPVLKYDEESRLFSISGDTRAFNVSGQLSLTPNFFDPNLPLGTQYPIPAFPAPAPYVAGDPAAPATTPYLRLFFNGNLYGLLTNFNNTYLGANGQDSIIFPLGGVPVPISIGDPNIPNYSYTNEILFTNQQFTNILNNNPLLQGLQGVPPPVYNPFFLIPTVNQNLYWVAKQDYPSTGSLWSPVASIVFTSALLPLKKEYTAAPILIGEGNVGIGTGSPSAFEPIICDFVVDQAIEKAEGWRDFSLYEPTAEYKMVSMNASHEEIRNIDIQVFWKYRLTGELIPLTMFNTSDVSMKMMFRKIDSRS